MTTGGFASPDPETAVIVPPSARHPLQLVPADYFRHLRPDEIFPPGPDGSRRPLEVDLGCGDGGFVLALAEHHPERDFLAVERLFGRARKVCKRAARRGLANVRVLRLESAYTLGWLLPDRSVSRLHLLFPDPWPKQRHHRLRLPRQDDFKTGLPRVLAPGGEFLFKTDDAPYFEDACPLIDALPGLKRLDWPDDGWFQPLTDFERQWLAQGRAVHRARWQRAPFAAPASAPPVDPPRVVLVRDLQRLRHLQVQHERQQ